MNINYSGQKFIFFFFYFSRNKISFFPPPLPPPPNFHLQFKMVRRASDDFILSFSSLMSIFLTVNIFCLFSNSSLLFIYPLPNFISQLGTSR